MNSNLIFGTIAFLLWSGFSSWYYVCNIKGLCLETDVSSEQIIDPEPTTQLASGIVEEKTDTIPIVAAQVELEVIEIIEDEIYFAFNSAAFTNRSYAEQFIQDVKKQVENRLIEIKIEGYTCDLGNEDYNMKLGLQRAKSMEALIINNDITPSKFMVMSEGEIASILNTKEERQKNRKVVITIKSIDQ